MEKALGIIIVCCIIIFVFGMLTIFLDVLFAIGAGATFLVMIALLIADIPRIPNLSEKSK